VLPLVAASALFLIGAVAFAVDVGWLYLNGSWQQNAADASALAAVVALPTDNEAWPASTAYQTAVDLAGTNGYASGETSPREVFNDFGVKLPNQIEVEITREVDTFFMKAFGIDSVTVTRTARAEFVPPLQLGSDESNLGTFPDDLPVCDEFGQPAGACLDPDDPATWGGVNVGYWVALNAAYTAKEHGDPFMTRCQLSSSINNCSSLNAEYNPDGWYYAVSVPPGAGSLSIDLFDARFWGGVLTSPTGAGDVLWYFNGGPSTTFRVFAPDQTPTNPADNNQLLCNQTLAPDNSGFITGGDPSSFEVTNLCNTFVGPGVYVVQVTAGQGHGVNGFSIRPTTSGSPAAVYGIGRMSIKANSPSSNPVFKLVKVTPVYAGKTIKVSLFDPGEAAGAAWVSFEGRASGLDCLITVRRAGGAVDGPWTPQQAPGGSPPGGNSSCYVQSAPNFGGGGGGGSEYNGDWIDFSFDVPEDYSCNPNGQDCWWTVRYTFQADEVRDRTSWGAVVEGQPIRLVLGN
jgi:hypothetical protein